MSAKTTDLNYSYNRKTKVENNKLTFSCEFDLSKEITDVDIADMILYICQRDLDLQNILSQYDEVTFDNLIKIINKYRLLLISQKL